MIKNPVPWPKGAKVAVNFTWDMDADSILHLAHPNDAATRVCTMSYLRYGPEVGVPRICEMFEDRGLKATFFIPAWCIEEHPRAVERILKGGHELAHHGYIHEPPNVQTRDRELYWTARASDVIERFSGKKPRGYRAPWYNYSRHTTEILGDLGFVYDSSLMGDDNPYIIRSRAGHELVEMPGHWPVDDWPHYVHNMDLDYMMPIESPRLAHECYMAEFEPMYKYGGYWQSVWHPFITGRPSRLVHVEKMIDDMLKRGKVWICTMEDAARHVKKLVDQGKYKPRIDTLPYKESRIAQLAEDATPGHG
ncbi:MAG TPA: polysaccharide deacetylase [Alphaproteobacteria bacterium]|nr:polysaccharide deacetylase [Alphaproteobacteria bacterium]